jgi:hypothetical protein
MRSSENGWYGRNASVSEIRLEVQLDGGATEFQAGGLLRAWVRVLAARPIPTSHLECRLLWITEGKGTEDVGGTLPKTLASERELQPGEVLPFETRVPLGPWTYDGRIVKIRWVVQAILESQEGDAVDAEVGFRLLPGVVSASQEGVA